MRHSDLAPLYRTTIGFGQIADTINEVSVQSIDQPNHPPYNIEKVAEDTYRISIAAAGFTTDDLSVEVKDNELMVTARNATDCILEVIYIVVSPPAHLNVGFD